MSRAATLTVPGSIFLRIYNITHGFCHVDKSPFKRERWQGRTGQPKSLLLRAHCKNYLVSGALAESCQIFG